MRKKLKITLPQSVWYKTEQSEILAGFQYSVIIPHSSKIVFLFCLFLTQWLSNVWIATDFPCPVLKALSLNRKQKYRIDP